MNLNGNHQPTIEALILSSPVPLPAGKIADLIDGATVSDVNQVIDKLNTSYVNNESSFRIREIAGGYQVYITSDYAPIVEELYSKRRSTRLSRAALETLAIISYRQPVTKMDVEMIRGVSSDSAIHTLMEKKLLTLAGRAQSVGRPLLYKTTDDFLKYFNLNSLEDLPRMEEIEELLTGKEPDNQQLLPLGPFTSSVPTEIASDRIVHLKTLKTTEHIIDPEIPDTPDEEPQQTDDADDETDSGFEEVVVGESEADTGEDHR
jgi:segregation and condensation protein B